RGEYEALRVGVPWKNVGSSLLVLLFDLLVVVVWLRGKEAFVGQIALLCTGGFLVLVLVVLRQFTAMYQIVLLQHDVRRKNRALNTLNEQLARQATTDPLTGLLNHRALAEGLDEVLARAQASGSMFSIIFVDLDHFK